MIRMNRSWMLSGVLVPLFAAAFFVAAPQAHAVEWEDEYSDAEGEGPGTRFLKCRAEAHAAYNSCLADAYDSAERYGCDLAWNLDLLACDISLILDMSGLKAIMKVFGEE
jgi:hypothetical protein